MNKRCPRCDVKMPIVMKICPSCQLNYEKFESATNKEAKIAISEGDYDRVLMRKGCPPDVNRWGLLLITIFLGFFGGHYYRVGRWKTGLVFTGFFFLGVINAVIMTLVKTEIKGDLFQVFTFLVLGWGVVIMLWIIDIAKVLLNKFRIPVSRER